MAAPYHRATKSLEDERRLPCDAVVRQDFGAPLFEWGWQSDHPSWSHSWSSSGRRAHDFEVPGHVLESVLQELLQGVSRTRSGKRRASPSAPTPKRKGGPKDFLDSLRTPEKKVDDGFGSAPQPQAPLKVPEDKDECSKAVTGKDAEPSLERWLKARLSESPRAFLREMPAWKAIEMSEDASDPDRNEGQREPCKAVPEDARTASFDVLASGLNSPSLTAPSAMGSAGIPPSISRPVEGVAVVAQEQESRSPLALTGVPPRTPKEVLTLSRAPRANRAVGSVARTSRSPASSARSRGRRLSTSRLASSTSATSKQVAGGFANGGIANRLLSGFRFEGPELGEPAASARPQPEYAGDLGAEAAAGAQTEAQTELSSLRERLAKLRRSLAAGLA